MAENIKPTRSELINLKNKIKLAISGHKLLKKKRDGLILEFFEVLKKAKTIRQELNEEYAKAILKMNQARAIEGDLKIKSIALAVKNSPVVEMDAKNIVGVRVPKISTTDDLKQTYKSRGFGNYNSISIDEAASEFEKVVEKIIKVAEVEITLRKLLDEIEKTKRRVNALEFEVIPKMKNVASFIRSRLEEMERENFSRLKIIKSRLN